MKRTKNKNGKKSDETLLEVIEDYPGLSQYELGRKLRWTNGHVDGSIRRLLKENKIFITVLERNGRQVNLIYSKVQKLSKKVEVPIELLTVSNPTWDKSAFVYALDHSTIGISGHEMSEWEEISCFLEKISLQKNKGKMTIEIPESFWRFYNLEKKHRVVSINGNNLLITVSGYIVEEKGYPT